MLALAPPLGAQVVAPARSTNKWLRLEAAQKAIDSLKLLIKESPENGPARKAP